MATNITKTSHFTAGAGNPISFSQIRAEFGGSAKNIKASTYFRNTDDDVDWKDASTITKRVPDATENSSVSTGTSVYLQIGLESWTSIHNAPILFTQAEDDDAGGGNQYQWLLDYISDIQSIPTNAAATITSVPTGGHSAFTTNATLQAAIRTALNSNAGASPIANAQFTIAPSDGETYVVNGISYPVMGKLYVPTGLPASSVDVVVVFHGTLNEGGNVTIANAAASSLTAFLDQSNLNVRDKIIFSVAYPQDHISKTRQYNLPNVGLEAPTFLMGDNLPYTRAAVRWVQNSLNSYIATKGGSKTIGDVYLFGHSQGGKLVSKMNTLETGITGVVANAPGPIQFDQTCEAQPGGTSCSKVSAIYGESTSAAGNWTVDSLRNTISQYVVTQSGTDTELSYSANNTGTWNNNLSKNVQKIFDVTGTVHADSPSDDALAFSGNLYNLEIEVDGAGAIYGEGGAAAGNGGDALYVNNTYSKRPVEVRSYGKIWSGGGGGKGGNPGNKGSDLSCYNIGTNTQSNYCSNWYAVNPNGVRNRCRGGGWRRGQGWNPYNATGYHCGNGNTYYCYNYSAFTVTGGAGGNAGGGGQGKGWSNRNISINSSPHIGNPGGAGGTSTCAIKGTSSTGNRGNVGTSGGDWGQSSTGSAGASIKKKNLRITYSTDNTIKGPIQDI